MYCEVVLGTVSLPGRKTASWWHTRTSLNPWEKECSARLSRLGTVSLPERKNASWGRTGNSLYPSEKEWIVRSYWEQFHSWEKECIVRSYWEQFKSLREKMYPEVELGTVLFPGRKSLPWGRTGNGLIPWKTERIVRTKSRKIKTLFSLSEMIDSISNSSTGLSWVTISGTESTKHRQML